MTVKSFIKLVFGLVLLFVQPNSCDAQDNETTLNQKYWTMRERFRKYFVSIGKNEGQGIPASKKQDGNWSGNRCGGLYSNSSGWMSWGDATGYLGDYMCTLATEYALLAQEGKDTKATLNELYYAINAIDRLDGIAEKTFDANIINNDYNGFFLRDDIEQSTITKWTNEYVATGSYDAKLNYQCLNSDHQTNLDGSVSGNSSTNEVSFDQIVTIFQGFSFIKKYIPNVYVKPTSTDAGFYLIDKMKSITANIMDYMSGTDRQLLRDDHPSELMFNVIAHPTPAIFGPGTPLAFTLNSTLGYLVASSDCADNDIRGNWILINPVTGRKVGVSSDDTKGQDIRLFADAFAKIGYKLTGDAQYLSRDIHHVAVDDPGDGYYCLNKHDYHIPLSLVSSAWNQISNMTTVPEDLVISLGPSTNTNPIFPIKNPLVFKLSSLPRNFYLFESIGALSGTWSHTNVNKFSNFYGHENMDLVYSCLNDGTPQNLQSHYLDLLSKLSCDGPHNYGQNDFTSFWNNPNSFEHPNPSDNIDPAGTYEYGEYNANDWMWLYNMYRLKFGNSSFPSYEDNTCNCKKSPVLEQNVNAATGILQQSITLKRVFKNYLKLGISLKEFNQGLLKIQNNLTLRNETELTVCGQVYVSGNGSLINTGKPTNEDSIKIVVRGGSGIYIQNNGTLDIGQNSKVIIQKTGQLISNGVNSRIIVRSGSKLIIEAGGLLELNNGSKLIVEDGGQVIIQCKQLSNTTNENAVLTYNQGAEIQLKGDYAILELNGRLHIGDNATFGFTYPGSNSGYIKFNRGNGWWDNWAPGNAHITCGSNAKINLVGQSKTDRLIQINQANCAIPKNLAQFTINKGLVDFTGDDAMLESAITTAYNNCTFKGFISNTQYNTKPTRGVVMYGQYGFFANNCDFIDLGNGLTGALFYGNNKLNNVGSCNFINCNNGIITIGAGATIKNNNFQDNGAGISCMDVVFNSLALNNTINSNYSNGTDLGNGAVGIFVRGGNSTFEIRENTINNQNIAVIASNIELKLKCNNLKSNSFALLGSTASKINMSSLLGAGYNNASNCNQFAHFDEAHYWEANKGFNSFKIIDSSPCYTTNIGPGHPDKQYCPTITNGTLINFTSYNTATHFYEQIAEFNFWKNLPGPLINIEYDYNKLQKVIPDWQSGSSTQYFDARLISGSNLINQGLINCSNNGNGSSGGILQNLTQRIHPLDENSNSAIINTASFYNKRLQKALVLSMNKMDDMDNLVKINEATDLLTEILKANYVTPVLNDVDKYLLELTYQKLFSCVAQLVEIHKTNGGVLNPMPLNLQNRFADLHTIINLRTTRKNSTDADFKEINDLISLDKATVYRLAEQRSQAINIIDAILANNPKMMHRNLYEHTKCIYQTEDDAINGLISLDEALRNLNKCNEFYSKIQSSNIPNGARLSNQEDQEDEIIFGLEHAIVVYPNPTQGNLIIAYNLKEFSSVSFEIFDVQGKSMLIKKLNPEEDLLNIENLNLENGVYFYNIIGDGKTLITKKLVVVK